MRFPYLLSRRSLLSALACSLWLLFWLPSAVWAGGFALQINDTSGLDEPWPLVAGLPFPEGALRDAEQIRILDATGAQVPAQMDVAATWRDGSLRWVQAGFTASPQGEYRVEYGEQVAGLGAATTDAGLRVYEHADGVTVDTGAAVYEFLGDRLLPETARMGGTEFLSGSGDGAYLVDNQGRLARVAGAAAGVTSTIVKQGPSRAVLRREGWYVTETGERVARTQAWFYFAAGTPYLRVTHSLIFTEDTNDLWVRDYGLEFRTPTPPSEALFALGDDSEFTESLLAMQPVAASRRELVSVDGDEVFMLQDDFPHFLERDSRAVVGRAAPLDLGGGPVHRDNLDGYEVVQSTGATGDWADGQFGNYGLTLVMPWLAQRFPKDIAFGPDGARAALWSGRSGRELDFRAATLVDEYWQSWADLAREGSAALAQAPSNAQGAARTHDLWLLPRIEPGMPHWLEARANAASQPPLVLADPTWLTATEAMGWPIHPLDNENFPKEETVISGFWDVMMNRVENPRRTGFIAFGDIPQMHAAHSDWFRVSGQVDYNLRRSAWSLYARSGDRRYYDYATRFSIFSGDYLVVHEDTPDKYKGETVVPYSFSSHYALYWGESSMVRPRTSSTGYDVMHWLFDYYLTGDERSLEVTQIFGEPYKGPRWEGTDRSGTTAILRVLTGLYAREWDEEFGILAQEHADYLIDLENSPNGINDDIQFGSLYKADRDLLIFYLYYRETGDEQARTAFLKGVEYKYQFNRVRTAWQNQSYVSFIFAEAYRLTEDPKYLRVVHTVNEEVRRRERPVGSIDRVLNPTMGLPTAFGVLSETGDLPVTPYPLARWHKEPSDQKLYLRKSSNDDLEFRASVWIDNDLDEGTATSVTIYDENDFVVSGVTMESETLFLTSNEARQRPRHRAVSVTIPGQEPNGLYRVEFNAQSVDVLESNASQVYVYAPEGTSGRSGHADYFWVPEGTGTVEFFFDGHHTLYTPDGTVLLDWRGGEREFSVNGRYGAWYVEPRSSGNSAKLLNLDPIFSREPSYVVPWSDAPLDESHGSLEESEDSWNESGDTTDASNGSLAGSDGSTDDESDGSLAGSDGSADDQSDDSLAGSDGSIDDESDGSLAGSDGSVDDESDGSLAGSDGSSEGSDDSLDGSDGSDGATAGSDGSLQESDGSPNGSDAPPKAPKLEVSLLRTDLQRWLE